MIDKTNAVRILLERVAKLPCGHALDIRTYKRNRSVVLVRRMKPASGAGQCPDGQPTSDRDTVLIIENGFAQERFCVPFARLGKILKTILRREFPRSTKIRVYDLGEFAEDKAGLDRKKI